MYAKVRVQRVRPFSHPYRCVSRGFFENSGIDESCCIFLKESTQRRCNPVQKMLLEAVNDRLMCCHPGSI